MEEQTPGKFVLVVDDFVTFVNPSDYDIDDIVGINPADYFITSGDAIAKTEYMLTKLIEVSKLAKKHYQHSTRKIQRQYYTDTVKAIAQCKVFIKELLKMRGTALWLECCWEDHKLLIVPKNPRAKED